VGATDDPIGLQRSVTQIQTTITRLSVEDGIPPHKVVIGGFSQGGAIAILTCYHPTMAGAADSGPYAGCVGLSAWLTLPDQVAGVDGTTAAATDDDDDDTTNRRTTPLFWGHGSYDDKVLFTQQAFGVERLKKIGVNVIDKVFPVDHSAHPREIEEFASFVDTAIFGTDSSEVKSTTTSESEAASVKNEL
jgi:lysophospholipase-2